VWSSRVVDDVAQATFVTPARDEASGLEDVTAVGGFHDLSSHEEMLPTPNMTQLSSRVCGMSALPQPCRPPPGRTGRSSPHRAPGPGATRGQPPPMGSPLAGALASVVAQQRWGIGTPHALDTPPLSPQARLDADHGQPRAERGVRCRNEPHGLAASRSRQPPERIMALLRVLTVCWLVSAALQDRIRRALKDQATTVANPPGHPGQHPTARGVFHDAAGGHRLLLPGPWPQVVNLPEGHQHLLQRRGTL
jgi:hypothetical protein